MYCRHSSHSYEASRALISNPITIGSFDNHINPLHETVGLWVVSGCDFMVNTQVCRKVLEPLRVELLVFVRNNDGWNAKFAHVVLFQSRFNRSRALVRQMNRYQEFSTSIFHGENVTELQGSIQRY